MEFGSGTARKTRRLIEALLRRQGSLRYVPIDISGAMLAETAGVLSGEYPGPYGGSHSRGVPTSRWRAPASERRGPALVLFLGSNLGNFVPDEAAAFLKGIRAMLGAGGPVPAAGWTCGSPPRCWRRRMTMTRG